jgi:hypothetical protein
VDSSAHRRISTTLTNRLNNLPQHFPTNEIIGHVEVLVEVSPFAWPNWIRIKLLALLGLFRIGMGTIQGLRKPPAAGYLNFWNFGPQNFRLAIKSCIRRSQRDHRDVTTTSAEDHRYEQWLLDFAGRSRSGEVVLYAFPRRVIL